MVGAHGNGGAAVTGHVGHEIDCLTPVDDENSGGELHRQPLDRDKREVA